MIQGRHPLALLAVLGTLLAGIAQPASAQRLDSTVAIGQGARIWSDALQEERRVLIHLPASYGRSGMSYPVLYLLDAETQFHHSTGIVQFLGSGNGRMPEMIVVAVTNTNRSRDLTPPTLDPEILEENSTVGGADTFLRFLADELAPWVNERYRTQPYRILVGHSLGGLFAVHTLMTRPDAFQAYIAVSPSLWWDKERTVERAKTELAKLPPGGRFIYLTWGDHEKSISSTTQRLVDWLKASPPANLQWAHRYYPGDDHGTTPHRSLYDGLEALFAGWALPLYGDEDDEDPKATRPKPTLADVEAHATALSARYGYPIKPNPHAINALAERLMEDKQHEAALALIRRNVLEYPWSADAHEQLGQALEKLGRPEEALRAYAEALRLGINDESAYGDPEADYRKRVRELQAPKAKAKR
jgi:predicted alpha/beta superfamily hydrolase